MSHDSTTPGTPPAGRVLQFPRLRAASPLSVPSGEKLGLYPLGKGEDIVISRALFSIILGALAHPTAAPEEREVLLHWLQTGYVAPFVDKVDK